MFLLNFVYSAYIVFVYFADKTCLTIHYDVSFEWVASCNEHTQLRLLLLDLIRKSSNYEYTLHSSYIRSWFTDIVYFMNICPSSMFIYMLLDLHSLYEVLSYANKQNFARMHIYTPIS